MREFPCIIEDAVQIFGLDQSLIFEWLSAWLVLNWGAHLALRQGLAEDTRDGHALGAFPKLSNQFTYVLHSLAIAWLIQWSWRLLPPIG
ncbi:hypothetical protein [Synechococcus sp. UW179A]|uniref:hypothetical protein n=1 Tax=Synechococcus sp. UW179A TaxID=2575510 RepID=UPI000E0E2A91|nr:hypothetical protein [Synechococcus sp. UW179A]